MKKAAFFLALIALVAATCFSDAYAQSAGAKLNGKWEVISKQEKKTRKGTSVKTESKHYEAGEKQYEFLEGSRLRITEAFGKKSKEIPYRLDGEKLYIGANERGKDHYTFRFDGDKVILTKTETDFDDGKRYTETEELVLQRAK